MPRKLATLLILTLTATALLLSAIPARAQEKPGEKMEKSASVYRVDFAVREKEDGTTNTRNYVMLLEDKGSGKVRAANRVPIPAGEKGIQYLDVGLNIDCDLRERDNSVSLRVWLEISDFASPGQEKASPPLLRTIRSEVQTAIAPGKPTVVSVVDDTATKRRYELEVTATKVK